MQKAPHYKADGAKSGEQSLPEWLFDGVVNDSAMHRVVKAYQANQRQGTGSAKNRSAVRGGSRKPWRQKGTGRARQGTIRAAQWVGGGRAFPPIPHSWRLRVPRKVRALARRSALNSRAEEQRVLVLDRIQMDAPKTRDLRTVLEAMGVEGKVLILTDGVNENLHLSARNMPHVETCPFGQESVYDILWANVVVIEKEALEAAEPSKADLAAQESRERGEPEIRAADREAIEYQAERKKARMGHDRAPRVQPVETPKAEKKASAPKAEKKAEAASDIDSVKLPNVSDLAEFLAGYDSVADIEALQARDSRKTAQTHYESRIDELSGGDEEE